MTENMRAYLQATADVAGVRHAFPATAWSKTRDPLRAAEENVAAARTALCAPFTSPDGLLDVLPDWSRFHLAVLAIAAHEILFARSDKANDEAAFNEAYYRSDVEEDNAVRRAASAAAQTKHNAAWNALNAMRENLLIQTPPDASDALGAAYYRWVRANVELDMVQNEFWASEPTDDSEEAVVTADGRRTEALTMFVAAAAQ